MHIRINILLAICLSLSNLPQPAWTRTLSVSLNMSLTRSELEDTNVTATSAPKLSQDMLQSCMRETEISMSQLKFFRLSLLFNDNTNSENELAPTTGDGDADLNSGNNLADFEYGSTAPILDLKRNEPLQCFVRCLYESLGLVHYDMMLEEAFRMQLQSLMQRLKPELKECRDMNSKNRCEAAYKLHLCYNHLKNLEAEQRLRVVLERSDNEDIDNANGNENGVSETSEKANEIMNAIQRYGEQITAKS